MMVWSDDLMAAVIVGLLMAAALADIAIRVIPDGIAIGLAVLGLATRLLAGLPGLAASVAVALVLFVALILMHSRGILGGGDVKLAAATAVGLPVEWFYRFVVVTALAGGVVALVHLGLRFGLRKPPHPPAHGASLARRVLAAERWRIMRHGSLPYGVAIACGGIWVVVASRGG